MVIDASRQFPGKQTKQHASAAHVLGVLTKNSEELSLKDGLDSKEAEYKSKDELIPNNISNKERVKVIVAQNKIDLIDAQKACRNVEEIRWFLGKYDRYLSQTTPIIPISAQSKLNLDALCMLMVRNYPKYSPRFLTLGNHFNPLPVISSYQTVHEPELTANSSKSLEINIIRSFDVNKPCTFNNIKDVDSKLRGGVLGGVIINGTIAVGDTVCIRPGIVTMRHDAPKVAATQKLNLKQKIEQFLMPKYQYQPIQSKVIGLKCGTKALETVFPGANVGIMLNIDPCLTKSDERAGDIICAANGLDELKLPVFNVFIMSYVRLKPFENKEFGLLEPVKVNIGAAKQNGHIVERFVTLDDEKKRNGKGREGRNEGIMVVLDRPICAKIASKVTLTRRMNGEWRLAAGGIIFSVRHCCDVSKSKK